jgi:hypothetical protein
VILNQITEYELFGIVFSKMQKKKKKKKEPHVRNGFFENTILKAKLRFCQTLNYIFKNYVFKLHILKSQTQTDPDAIFFVCI